MVIISSFTDFYDFYSNIYGADNKIVFNRKQKLKPFFLSNKRLFFPFDYRHVHFNFLIVCGRCYIIKREECDSKPKDKVISFQESQTIFSPFLRGIYSDAVFETESQELIGVSKKLGTPIFKVTGCSWNKYEHLYCYHIDSQIPSLQELGFSKFQSPEEVYQNVSYFLSNVLNPSPDLSPPVSITDNKVKILEHGFDLKTSFRGKNK